jgi:transglutaminase-like putative cysteine protease
MCLKQNRSGITSEQRAPPIPEFWSHPNQIKLLKPPSNQPAGCGEEHDSLLFLSNNVFFRGKSRIGVPLPLMGAWRLLPFPGLGERGRPTRSRRRLADGFPWSMSTTCDCTPSIDLSRNWQGGAAFGVALLANGSVVAWPSNVNSRGGPTGGNRGRLRRLPSAKWGLNYDRWSYMHKRRHLWARGASILYLTLLPGVFGQNQGILAGPEPGWVAPAPLSPQAAQAAAGPEAWRYLLHDRQINGQTRQVYAHDAEQAATVSGVKAISEIQVSFDPACQTLAFHWLRVWHNGVARDELDTSRIVTGPRAEDADNPIFSGDLTARVTVGDLQPGDVVDYAYTVTGLNPAWNGHWFGALRMQLEAPAQHLRARVLWPTNRLIYMKNYLTTVSPVVNRAPGMAEFSWDARDVPGLNVQADLPFGYDPFPAVEISEFHQWAEVNRWASRLFTNAAPPSAALASQIDDWRRLRDPVAQAAAVLRFLQDEIRDVDESGSDAYKLALPNAVFDRRSGDSKDKAFLYCSSLRALGIQCWPALVNTRLRQDVANRQPDPTVFDHVMVVVSLSGRDYWLDPTSTYQRGPLANMDYPAYGYALLVRPGAATLTPVPLSSDQPATIVTENFDVGRPDVPVAFKSVTLAKGGDAVALRRLYANTPPLDIEKQDLDMLARDYPHIEQTAPSIFHDDEQANQIEVDRFYKFVGDWADPTNVGSWYSLRLYSHNVDAVFPKPTDNYRTMPLCVPYPCHEIYKANIHLAAWIYTPTGDQTVTGPGFYLHWAVNFPDNGHVVMESEFNALQPAVSADMYAEYQRDLEKASSLLDLTLGYYPE